MPNSALKQISPKMQILFKKLLIKKFFNQVTSILLTPLPNTSSQKNNNIILERLKKIDTQALQQAITPQQFISIHALFKLCDHFSKYGIKLNDPLVQAVTHAFGNDRFFIIMCYKKMLATITEQTIVAEKNATTRDPILHFSKRYLQQNLSQINTQYVILILTMSAVLTFLAISQAQANPRFLLKL